MEKRLYRSKKEKMLCGVCTGIAKYCNADPTVIRLLWALTSCFAPAGIVAYIAAAFIIPEEPDYLDQGDA